MKYLGMLLLFGWVAVACKPAPKGNEAKARIEVNTSYGDPRFAKKQAKLAVSSGVLRSVVEELDLAERWALENDDQALDRLEDLVSASVVEGTDLIDIVARLPLHAESVEIADAVVEEFRVTLFEAQARKASKALDALEQKIEEQNERLERSRVKMLDTMEKYANMTDRITEKDSGRQRRNSAEFIEAKRDYELQKKALQSIQSHLWGERIDTGSRVPLIIHEFAH